MTDARFPERWLNDRRVVRLSDGAFRLYVTSLAWSASNRTDGHLEPEDVKLIHGVDSAKSGELVAAELWRQTPRGWYVVEFANTQTSREQLEGLEHKRHMDRERKARERARARGGNADEPPGGGSPSEGVSAVTSDVTAPVTHRPEQGQGLKGKALTGATDVPGERRDDDDHDQPFLPRAS
jgi:hypothetical protein